MLTYFTRSLLFVSGVICVILGLMGMALPLLPTTPFLLLAACCFARSSLRMHRWLLASPLLGPVIVDWEQAGLIRRKTKIVASVLMLATVTYPLIFVIQPIVLKVGVVMVIMAVLGFMWSRPSEGSC